jgi:glycosyltransferase involved in cell wall biosynthesis
MGCAPVLTFAKLDARFSRSARARAAKSRSNLFLYSPYAWEAFSANYEHSLDRVLFQYHPHPDTERRILEEDAKHFPDFAEASCVRLRSRVPECVTRRERDVWRYADLIICASNFTRRSLLDAGCDESLCRVIPYGIDLPSAHGVQSPREFRVLFVGSGGQRKGLHHLLLAWQRASLPKSSKLVVACRAIEPGIERIAATSPRVEIRRGVSEAELQDLYGSSLLFVMPSLVEGFGQVYLEAMAHGCPVLGTPNTGLPDLGGESDGIFLVPAGNVGALTDRLEFLADLLTNNHAIRAAARACATRFTWPDFRLKIRKALDNRANSTL